MGDSGWSKQWLLFCRRRLHQELHANECCDQMLRHSSASMKEKIAIGQWQSSCKMVWKIVQICDCEDLHKHIQNLFKKVPHLITWMVHQMILCKSFYLNQEKKYQKMLIWVKYWQTEVMLKKTGLLKRWHHQHQNFAHLLKVTFVVFHHKLWNGGKKRVIVAQNVK